MYAPSDEIVSEDVVPQAELDKQPDKVKLGQTCGCPLVIYVWYAGEISPAEG
jgi:hypothetical protein